MSSNRMARLRDWPFSYRTFCPVTEWSVKMSGYRTIQLPDYLWPFGYRTRPLTECLLYNTLNNMACFWDFKNSFWSYKTFLVHYNPGNVFDWSNLSLFRFFYPASGMTSTRTRGWTFTSSRPWGRPCSSPAHSSRGSCCPSARAGRALFVKQSSSEAFWREILFLFCILQVICRLR